MASKELSNSTSGYFAANCSSRGRWESHTRPSTPSWWNTLIKFTPQYPAPTTAIFMLFLTDSDDFEVLCHQRRDDLTTSTAFQRSGRSGILPRLCAEIYQRL